MDLTDVFVQMLGLPRPEDGQLCQEWNRGSPTMKGEAWELKGKIHLQLRGANFTSVVQGNTHRLGRPAQYMSACMALAG